MNFELYILSWVALLSQKIKESLILCDMTHVKSHIAVLHKDIKAKRTKRQKNDTETASLSFKRVCKNYKRASDAFCLHFTWCHTTFNCQTETVPLYKCSLISPLWHNQTQKIFQLTEIEKLTRVKQCPILFSHKLSLQH